MIKDRNECDRLMRLFHAITNADREQIELEYMPHYVIYTRNDNHFECYCTHCRRHYEFEKGETREWMTGVCHKNEGTCLKCGYPVTFLSSGYGRGNVSATRNFAVFSRCEDGIAVQCYEVRESFIGDELVMDYSELQRYYISVGAVQHWRIEYTFLHKDHVWEAYWKPLKSENEPFFSGNTFYGKSKYTFINENIIVSTSLKYAQLCIDDSDSFTASAVNDNYIKYLCEYAKHPNIEYLMKSGFGFLIGEQLEYGNRSGVRINYHSNDVRKMLRLNKKEMTLLANTSSSIMSVYLWFRNELSITAALQAARKFESHIKWIKDIKKLTGLSVRKIINYADSNSLIDWNDYLHECQKLDYDLTDSLINCPKDLPKAHERTTNIIKYKADEIMQRQLEKRNKLLKKLEYTDKKRGLQIIVPNNMEEIIEEGKRLNHCVGGYAKRHAQGTLTILFLRNVQKPDVPYYTMEVSNNGEIVQCRGFKNNCAGNPKPQEIRDFENEYQQFLDKLFKKKGRKTA